MHAHAARESFEYLASSILNLGFRHVSRDLTKAVVIQMTKECDRREDACRNWPGPKEAGDRVLSARCFFVRDLSRHDTCRCAQTAVCALGGGYYVLREVADTLALPFGWVA